MKVNSVVYFVRILKKWLKYRYRMLQNHGDCLPCRNRPDVRLFNNRIWPPYSGVVGGEF